MSRLSRKRIVEISNGYSATHDVETVPLAEEALRYRLAVDALILIERVTQLMADVHKGHVYIKDGHQRVSTAIAVLAANEGKP